MPWSNFTAPNMGLLVYKRLYTERQILGITEYKSPLGSEKEKLFINIPQNAKSTPFDEFYKDLFEKTLNGCTQIENEAAGNKFHLKTTYPGLLCGTGYTHDSNAKGDIKIGFYFDHTTGQPVIPGSSIKGVLKSMFENEQDKTDESSILAFQFFIKEIMEAETSTDEKQRWQNIFQKFKNDKNGIKDLDFLKQSIFGTQDKEGEDIFFDAVIHIKQTGKNKKFIASDFITPHPNPLKNPTPLMFLKVLPEVTFEFRFCLKKYSCGSITITSDQKTQLFKKILLTIGIGAKTNVGYGQFVSQNTK